LWTPEPLLFSAGGSILNAWDTHRTGIVWDKEIIGMGYYVRQQHEHLLIATRGDMPTPLPQNRPSSINRARRGEHSRKPDEAYELIERMYPDLPLIELFARGLARPGWAAWGNQAEAPAEPPYDAAADFAGSLNVAYGHIRQRMANGGPPWMAPPADATPRAAPLTRVGPPRRKPRPLRRPAIATQNAAR
jgi:hypothetical protein